MVAHEKDLSKCRTGRGAGSARRGALTGAGRGGRRSGSACATRLAAGAVAAGAAAAAYMVFEAQWVQCRQADLEVPGLPAPWSGLTILHLADIHAGQFRVNERSLAKVIDWAEPLAPDLVFLTGDNVGDPRRCKACLQLLSRLRPPLGMFAVTGNHEYGLSKGPLARPLDPSSLWAEAGITLLSDSCIALPARDGAQVTVCGGNYITGGFDLVSRAAPACGAAASAGDARPAPPSPAPPAPLGQRASAGVGPAAPILATAPGAAAPAGAFPILLIHEPPECDSPLFGRFPLAFAGHTHGGQLRMPTPSGLRVISREEHEYLCGVHPWGAGLLVVTRGVGASFLPFRLLTRPEATLWRLVYTSCEAEQSGKFGRGGSK
jgi:predicted MPP superfamily phosphohydrolase